MVINSDLSLVISLDLKREREKHLARSRVKLRAINSVKAKGINSEIMTLTVRLKEKYWVIKTDLKMEIKKATKKRSGFDLEK
jgi:hypothetical protein